jgi:hypothetical protein
LQDSKRASLARTQTTRVAAAASQTMQGLRDQWAAQWQP